MITMRELKNRLRALDLAEPPDVWGEATLRFESGGREQILPSLVQRVSGRPLGGRAGRQVRRRSVAALAVAIVVIGGLAIITAAGSDTKLNIVVTSAAMSPTLEAGQSVVLDPDAYVGVRPARGDIIAFSVPEYPDIIIIKRVIGLPGERVEQVDGIVYIDGQPLDEPYAVADRSGDGAWVVKSGHLFVVGDNRPNSNDSRYSMGQIPLIDVEGQILVGEETLGDPLPPPPAPVVQGP